MRTPERQGGYLPIADYAAIGDGRTVALVGLDGTVDWLCLPDLDSASTFGALLDPDEGGAFELAPAEPFETERRYVIDTNVLETTFTCASGTARVTDALVLSGGGPPELLRRVEGLAGEVALRWRIRPRFEYGRCAADFGRGPTGISAYGDDVALAVSTFDAGDDDVRGEAIEGAFDLQTGERALLALTCAEEPAGRDAAEARLNETIESWRRWTRERAYDGDWRDEVLRSALVLKLLIDTRSGAIAAAATTSLPEMPGGGANWDYRYSWVRDASYVADSLLELGCGRETRSVLSWALGASAPTHPRMQVVYRLDGNPNLPERELALPGYRRARPVRIGNAATEQLQLGIYGDLLETAWLYVAAGNSLPPEEGERLAEIADLVCEQWRERDSGIWEERDNQEHFTESKLMCWVALERASRLAAAGQVPASNVGRWAHEADAISAFIERECWSERVRSYTRFADSDELDAAPLLAAIVGYRAGGEERVRATVDAVRDSLARGPFVWRYRIGGELGHEGAFLACSFWLVSALAATGRRDEAGELFEQLLGAANDVGLYSEEIEPESGELLGNFPQALTHLALIGAAQAIQTGEARI